MAAKSRSWLINFQKLGVASTCSLPSTFALFLTSFSSAIAKKL